jgi:8-amino-7-oxononanoate synthase
MFDLESQLRELDEAGLLRRRRIVDGPQGTHLAVHGKEYLSFCSNDYLG